MIRTLPVVLCGMFCLILSTATGLPQESTRSTDVEIQLQAVVTIKGPGPARTYTCPLSLPEGCSVSIRSLQPDKLRQHLVFQHPKGFVDKGRWAPRLVLWPELDSGQQPIWKEGLETPVNGYQIQSQILPALSSRDGIQQILARYYH